MENCFAVCDFLVLEAGRGNQSELGALNDVFMEILGLVNVTCVAMVPVFYYGAE